MAAYTEKGEEITPSAINVGGDITATGGKGISVSGNIVSTNGAGINVSGDITT